MSGIGSGSKMSGSNLGRKNCLWISPQFQVLSSRTIKLYLKVLANKSCSFPLVLKHYVPFCTAEHLAIMFSNWGILLSNNKHTYSVCVEIIT